MAQKPGMSATPRKAPRRKPTGQKPSGAADRWERIALADAPACESDVVALDQRDDRIDSSQALVRGKRFRGSYMKATNGGATFEDLLQSDRVAAEAGPARDAAEAGAEEPGLQNVLGGSDERVLVADTSRIPARSIGLLKIMPADGILRYGTAWLIGPRTLATAAHNLLHPQVGETRRLDVGMAYDGKTARGGWHRVVDCAFDLGWRRSPSVGSPYDYAVLKIENSAIGNRLGWFGFADYEDAKFGNLAVNIFGYPMDRKRFHMYGVKGRVLDADGGRVFYDCDAGGGMSGGPVIARFDGQRIAVGVHVAGGRHSNVGTRINDAAYRLFDEHREW